MENKKIKIFDILLPFITIGIIFIVWVIVSKIIDEEIIFPKLSSTLKSLFSLLKTKEFYIALLNTIIRILISFLISFILAIILAILASLSKYAGKIMSIFSVIVQSIPTMSIILISLIWLTTMRAPLLVAILVTFPIMFTSFLQAINNIDKNLLEMVNVYKVPLSRKIKYLYIPQIAPSMFSAMKSSISLNVKVIIAAEVMAQTKDSIGVKMQLSSLYLEMSELFAWTIVSIILGLIFEGVILLIQKLYLRSTRW